MRPNLPNLKPALIKYQSGPYLGSQEMAMSHILLRLKKGKTVWMMVAHDINPSTWEAEAGGALRVPAWFTEQVLGQPGPPGLYGETLLKTKENKTKTKLTIHDIFPQIQSWASIHPDYFLPVYLSPTPNQGSIQPDYVLPTHLPPTRDQAHPTHTGQTNLFRE
jgi:hypothetical protein